MFKILRPLMLVGLLWMAVLAPAPARTTLRFWHAMRGNKGDAVRTLVARFNQKYPDIQVEEKFIGSEGQRYGNDYHALYRSILEHVAQGDPPEVAQVYENWTTQLIDIQALVPVQQFVSGADGLSPQDLGDFIPIFRDANTFNGKLWTVPFNKSIWVLYYNKKLVPRAPATLDELRTVARQVAQSHKGVSGLAFEPGVDMFGNWLFASGGDFFSGSRAAFNSPQGVAALKGLVGMVSQDKSAQPSLEAQRVFEEGRAAMYIFTTSSARALQAKCPFPLGIAPLPAGAARVYQFAGTNLAIFSHHPSDRQAAAWKFVKFMVSPESSAYFAQQTGYLPVSRRAIQSPAYQEFLKANPAYGVGLQALQYARMQPRISAWESIRGIIDDAVFEALAGKSTPAQALNRAAAQSDDLIKKLMGRPQ